MFAFQMRPRDTHRCMLTEPGPEQAVLKQEVQRWERRAGWSGEPGTLRGKWDIDGRESLGCCLANVRSLSPAVGRERKVFSSPHGC